MKSKSEKGKKVLLALIILPIISIIVAVSVFFSIYFSAKLDKDTIIAEKASLKIVDVKGAEIDGNVLNRYVKYENISTNIINAFVALEDKRFFNHKGVDYYRVAGALVKNIKSGYIKEGGSTITQQLAKNTQLDSEKTLTRKIKEMKLAHDIEKLYSKEEILEMYLNAIYYGNGIYGIDSACKIYFDKSPLEITIPEAAILAGIVKNPSSYSPLKNEDKALERMKLVCKLMFEQGYISEKEYDNAVKYEYKQPKNEKINPYFSSALQEACEILNLDEKNLIKSGYTISCFYDCNLQKTVSEIASASDYSLSTNNGQNALSSVVLCDNVSGGILAVYGSETANPLTLKRSPGSAIKPIAVYAPALEKGVINEATLYIDEKTDFNGYMPSNYKDIYIGETDIETAVKNSINTVAVKVFKETGKEYCINKAIETGISVDKNDNNLAFSLGGMTYGTTARELCQSYMCLANGGKTKKVGCVKSISDGKGNVIYTKPHTEQAVFSSDTACIMTDMLIKTAKTGTAKKLSSLNFDVAAKTGTVSGVKDNSDAWCLSYTPEYTLCVWYGGTNNTAEDNIRTTGGGMPTLLSYAIYNNIPIGIKEFSAPEGLFTADIDLYAREKTGKTVFANEYTPSEFRKTYLFSESNSPRETSSYFKANDIDFQVVYENRDRISIKFNTEVYNNYKITRLDLLHGVEKTIYESTLQAELPPVIDCIDNLIERNCVYSYRLDILCEGYTIGSRTTTVIT